MHGCRSLWLSLRSQEVKRFAIKIHETLTIFDYFLFFNWGNLLNIDIECLWLILKGLQNIMIKLHTTTDFTSQSSLFPCILIEEGTNLLEASNQAVSALLLLATYDLLPCMDICQCDLYSGHERLRCFPLKYIHYDRFLGQISQSEVCRHGVIYFILFMDHLNINFKGDWRVFLLIWFRTVLSW